MKEFQLISHSARETYEIARRFSPILRSGDVVGLIGELGAGKTVFVQGFCAGLQYTGSVTSPTFTIMHLYPTQPPVYHFDAFRLHSSYDLHSTGFEDVITQKQSLVLVEWADNIRAYFDDYTVVIHFAVSTEDAERRLLRCSFKTPKREKEIEKLWRAYQTADHDSGS